MWQKWDKCIIVPSVEVTFELVWNNTQRRDNFFPVLVSLSQGYYEWKLVGDVPCSLLSLGNQLNPISSTDLLERFSFQNFLPSYSFVARLLWVTHLIHPLFLRYDFSAVNGVCHPLLRGLLFHLLCPLPHILLLDNYLVPPTTRFQSVWNRIRIIIRMARALFFTWMNIEYYLHHSGGACFSLADPQIMILIWHAGLVKIM